MVNPIFKAANAFLAIFYNLPGALRSIIYVGIILFLLVTVVSFLNRLR